jgi:hypothetical protein
MDEGNHRKLVTVFGLLIEIQTGHLPNTSEKDYHLTQLAWYLPFVLRCRVHLALIAICMESLSVEHTLPFKYLENFTPYIFNNKFNCTVISFYADKVVTYIGHEIIFILFVCHTHIFPLNI